MLQLYIAADLFNGTIYSVIAMLKQPFTIALKRINLYTTIIVVLVINNDSWAQDE